jgi:hypothetical protein
MRWYGSPTATDFPGPIYRQIMGRPELENHSMEENLRDYKRDGKQTFEVLVKSGVSTVYSVVMGGFYT